jgi:hypothetical protein
MPGRGQPVPDRRRRILVARWAGRAVVAAPILVVVIFAVARFTSEDAPFAASAPGGTPSSGERAVDGVLAGAGLVVQPGRLDLGDVFMDVSEVPMSFTVSNPSDRVVVITYIETSCDCTTASLVLDGRQGPTFAMSHGTPPGSVDWRAVLAPGEQATLQVRYNPQAHGVYTPAEAPAIHGRVTRLVRLHTDEPRDSFVDLRIDLNQRH